MAASRSTSPAELLLQLLELTSLGAVSSAQITKQLRRANPFARLAQRVSNGLMTLEAEGLIESTDDSEERLFRITPSGLATLEAKGRFPGAAAVLFTDIVGSTELIEVLGETGAHESRQRHFSLLRKAIADNGGREVKNLGDGLMVVFSGVDSATLCATAMQRSVARDQDRLGLRIGVHSGELLRDGNDFFGSTVIIARRLCDSAQAGQIVVSDEARGQLGDVTDESFEALGPVALKGLTDAVRASSSDWSTSSTRWKG
jgi:class 3 adenylate cyclase